MVIPRYATLLSLWLSFSLVEVAQGDEAPVDVVLGSWRRSNSGDLGIWKFLNV